MLSNPSPSASPAVGVPFSFTAPLSNGETLPGVILDADVRFEANFAGSAFIVAGAAPAAPAIHKVHKVAPNGTVTEIGSLTINADKTVSISSTASSSFVVPAGYGIQGVGPAVADGQLSNLIGELRGSYA